MYVHGNTMLGELAAFIHVSVFGTLIVIICHLAAQDQVLWSLWSILQIAISINTSLRNEHSLAKDESTSKLISKRNAHL